MSGRRSTRGQTIRESLVSRESLARRAGQRFAWHWQSIQVAGQTTRLAVASNPDAMLIEACRRQDAGEPGVIDPFWATTWRAAAGLDRFLDRFRLEGTRVLELGCGTGHVGLAAAYRGGQVTLTDGVSDPLLLVRLSTWDMRERCTVRRLRFGLDRLNEPPFPLIVGSDVTYLRSLWPELHQCLNDHLARTGQVLLSDPYRLIADEFREWIQSRGWKYLEHRVEIDDMPAHPIRVMQLHK
jgi:predicted nicotinamide N-methyase